MKMDKRNWIKGIFWVVFLVSVGLMDYFGPENLKPKIFIFTAPILALYFLLCLRVTPLKQLDVRLQFIWVVIAILLFPHIISSTKLDPGIALIFKKTFYTCWFLFFSVSLTLAGIYYKNNESTVLSDYAPILGAFNRSKNYGGWISAYFWTAFAGFIVALMILYIP